MLTDFQFFFTDKLNGKFAIKSCLNIPPHLKHVATLATCQKTDNNLKYVFRLMTNHEIAQPSIYVVISYFITNLSFNLLVKKKFKSANIWQSYQQNG